PNALPKKPRTPANAKRWERCAIKGTEPLARGAPPGSISTYAPLCGRRLSRGAQSDPPGGHSGHGNFESGLLHRKDKLASAPTQTHVHVTETQDGSKPLI